MYPELIMFEVHYGGRFSKEHRVNYVGGDVAHYPDPYDRDEVSFIEVERVAKTYGYISGDLIYYNIPTKSLDEGLRLLSSDHNVLQMLEHYIGHGIVELYLVAFVAVDVHVDLEGEEDGVDEEGEEEYEQPNVYRTDGFWDKVLSDDFDAFESNGDGHTRVGLDADEGGEAELWGDQGFGVEEEDGVDLEVGRAEVRVDQGFEHEAVEDGNERGEDGSYSGNRSGVLVSPTPSNEEDADEVESEKRVCIQKRVSFSAEDMLTYSGAR
jgi:hypothetical protein